METHSAKLKQSSNNSVSSDEIHGKKIGVSEAAYDESIFARKISERELSRLEKWQDLKIFDQWARFDQNRSSFIYYDGPPFATGTPHYGHIVPHTLKDIFPKYQHMQGFNTPSRFGWDCHGLPVEHLVESSLQEAGRNVDELSVREFNDACRAMTSLHVDTWKMIESRLGRFVDMDNPYATEQVDYMESVWAIFKELHDKGLIYEGYRVTPYSPPLATTQSNFEAGLNYKDIESPSITLRFPLVDRPNTELLSWTTTPWSVPGNVALAINPSLNYVEISSRADQNETKYILCEDAARRLFSEDTHVFRDIPVGELVGQKYRSIYQLPADATSPRLFTVVESSHVMSDTGTGIVHISPAFGEDDYAVGQQNSLPFVDYFDKHCRFSESARSSVATADPRLQSLIGVSFRDANEMILQQLEKGGNLFSSDTIVHSYPHCWRTEQPLIQRASPSWFLAVTQLKERLLANNEKINWMPENVGERRFANWLSAARDWNISRERIWGNPLPVWKAEEDGELLVLGSKGELEAFAGRPITDLHRDAIDDIVIQRNGKTFRRIEAVLDCWFESGAMPYASVHYPFSVDKETLKERFPADLVAEGLDQTRGWFYTLLVLSTALFDSPPFKNVIVNGIVLAEDGAKMSKRLKNYTPVEVAIEQYGGDALRYCLSGSHVTRAQDFSVKADALSTVVKDIILPVQNIYQFFAMYCSADNYRVSSFDVTKAESAMDCWMIQRTETFRDRMEAAYNSFDTIAACKLIREFVDDISMVYVRSARARMWAEGLTEDKHHAYGTLFHALETFCLCAAPIMPFITDEIYTQLHPEVDSVHLASWPERRSVEHFATDAAAVESFLKIIHIGNQVRTTTSIRKRQPLQTLYLEGVDSNLVERLSGEIRSELNVKSIVFVDNLDDIMSKKVSLNLPVVGARLGKDVPLVRAKLAAGDYTLSNSELTVAGHTFSPNEYFVDYSDTGAVRGSREGGVGVAFDTTMTQSLVDEGQVRDLVRQIQDMRKQARFHMSDRIIVQLTGDLQALGEKFRAYIERETLSTVASLEEPSSDVLFRDLEITGAPGQVAIRKITLH